MTAAAVGALVTDFTLRPRLEEKLREGKLLLGQSDMLLGPTADDIEGWEAEVEYLLRDDRQKLVLFRRDPDARAAPLLMLGGPDWRRLRKRVEQLEKVIDLC